MKAVEILSHVFVNNIELIQGCNQRRTFPLEKKLGAELVSLASYKSMYLFYTVADVGI